ncbi:MAG TPA: stage III sporulation protein D [Ruminococcaceae bacterium]|nr:stage III sporulation protein D [Oscillospiraceae bacterium]
MRCMVEERAIELGRYIVQNNATVRAAAKQYGISKSTVHTDVSRRLSDLNPFLFEQVRAVLDRNKAQRHIRGGQATRMKYGHSAQSE